MRQLGHVGPFADLAFCGDGFFPGRGRKGQNGQADVLSHLKSNGELDAAFDQGVDELVRGPGRVGPHQHGDTALGVEAQRCDGQLGQSELEDLYVVIDVMGRRVARSQQHRQCFLGGVAKTGQRMEAIPTLVGGPGPGPLAVGVDQGGVEIQDQRAMRAHRRQSGRPRTRSGLGPGGPDGAEASGIDRVDDPRGRGRRRHWHRTEPG